MLELASHALLLAGAFFYCAGTIGLIRFPDVYARLHALAKADNLGLGCVLVGLSLQSENLLAALKLLLIWPLVLAASAAVSYTIAHRALTLGVPPWQKNGS